MNAFCVWRTRTSRQIVVRESTTPIEFHLSFLQYVVHCDYFDVY